MHKKMPTWFRVQNPFVKKCSYPTFSTGITVSAGLSGSNLCIIFSARWSKALQMTSTRVQGGSALQTQTMLRDVTRIKWPSEIPFRDIQYLTAWDVWSSQRLNIIKTWACSRSTAQNQIQYSKNAMAISSLRQRTTCHIDDVHNLELKDFRRRKFSQRKVSMFCDESVTWWGTTWHNNQIWQNHIKPGANRELRYLLLSNYILSNSAPLRC